MIVLMYRRSVLFGLAGIIPTGCLRLTTTETAPSTRTTRPEQGDSIPTTPRGTETGTPTPTTGHTEATSTTAQTAPTEPTETEPPADNQISETSASSSAAVDFEVGEVDRDGRAGGTARGVIATIQDYGNATRVQIMYRIPDQNAVLYRSKRFLVSAVQQPGGLGPRQQDPARNADQLMASDIDTDRSEYGPYEGEEVLVLFYNEEESLIDSVIYEVGTGTLEKTVTTPPTDEDDLTPTTEPTPTDSG